MSAHVSSPPQAAIRWVMLSILAVVGVVAATTYSYWSPLLGGLDNVVAHGGAASVENADGHSHAETDSHAHNNPSEIELSPQAQQNIGLKVGPIALAPYERAVTIPGMIIERPGRTSVAVAAPLTGVVTEIAAVEGEAVVAGQELFKIRLTHEEIVQAQGEFLKTLAELDVNNREMKRLESVAAEGAI